MGGIEQGWWERVGSKGGDALNARRCVELQDIWITCLSNSPRS